MKTFFDLISAVAFSSFIMASAKPGLPNRIGTEISSHHKTEANGVRLEYSGNMVMMVINAPLATIVKTPDKEIPNLPHKQMNFGINLQVEIDTLIGIRYEVSIRNGNIEMVHTAIFYKFDTPNQTISYDYLRHTSDIDTSSETPGSGDNGLTIIGQEVVDSLTSTHLRQAKNQWDFWMSPNIPGFAEMGDKLLAIDPSLPMTFDDNIFNWGGLVKMTGTFNDPKAATFVNFKVELVKANSNMDFPPGDFDVPSQ